MATVFAYFDHPIARRIGWSVVIISLLVGVIGGLNGGLKDRPDWRSFYHEPCEVWENQAVDPGTKMFGYPPAAFFALWPFTAWSPQPLGLFVFTGMNVAAALVSCWVLYRWWFVSADRQKEGGFVWVLALTCVYMAHVLRSNQLTLWVLVLCVVGLTLLSRRREWTGGLVLGLAGCIKVMPLVFVGYLLLRLRWRGVAGMVLAVIVFDILPSVAFFGLEGAIREHQNWLQRTEWYSSARLIEDPYLRIRKHGNNCAYSVVLARWLRPPQDAAYQVILRGDPPEDVIEKTRDSLGADEYLVLDPRPVRGQAWTRHREEIFDVPRFRLATMSARSVRIVWTGTLAVGIGALCLATWRRRKIRPGGTGWTAEASLWMLLMLWPTPMMRDYYLALAIPACVVVYRMVLLRPAASHAKGTQSGNRGVLLAVVALGVVLASVLSLDWSDANYYGVHLGALAALAAVCTWAWRRACVEDHRETCSDDVG